MFTIKIAYTNGEEHVYACPSYTYNPRGTIVPGGGCGPLLTLAGDKSLPVNLVGLYPGATAYVMNDRGRTISTHEGDQWRPASEWPPRRDGS